MPFVKRLDNFVFPNPDQWYCGVQHYGIGLSELRIKVQNMTSGEALIIVLVATIYFEGPLMWQSADFVLEPQENCVALMQKIGETDLKILLEARRLFSARIAKAADPK